MNNGDFLKDTYTRYLFSTKWEAKIIQGNKGTVCKMIWSLLHITQVLGELIKKILYSCDEGTDLLNAIFFYY